MSSTVSNNYGTHVGQLQVSVNITLKKIYKTWLVIKLNRKTG